jgi:uncharacterized protein YukE
MAVGQNVQVDVDALKAAAPVFDRAAQKIDALIQQIQGTATISDTDDYAQQILDGLNGLSTADAKMLDALRAMKTNLTSFHTGVLAAASTLHQHDTDSAGQFRVG